MKYQQRKNGMDNIQKSWWMELKGKVLGALLFVACAVILAFPISAQATNYEYLQFEKESMNGNTIWGYSDSFFKASLDGHGGFFSAKRSSFGGLPTNGIISFGGISYKLQIGVGGDYAYNGNDSVHLTNDTRVRTIEFQDDQSYDKMYILATAGGPGAGNYVNFNVKVTYSDGSTTTATYRVYDWFDTRAVSGVSMYAEPRRVLTQSGAFDGASGKGPGMRAACIDTDETKVIRTITFSMAGLNGSESQLNRTNVNCAVYAMTGVYSSYVPARPDPVNAHDIYGTGFYLSWDDIPDASYYCVDVSEYADFRTTIKGYNNKKVTDNTVEVTGVKPYTTYYYRVRAVNRYGAGRNSYIKSVYTYVPNTTYVNLTLDDAAWDNQTVELYQKGKAVYRLDNLAAGEYGNNIIMNGTYDIYVNGKSAMEQITFNYQGTNMRHGDTLAVNINYDTVTVTTRLDESVSAAVGDLELRQDGQKAYRIQNDNGKMSFLVKNTANDTYSVYINNRYTGKDIDVAANTELELDYYEMLFGVNYTTRKLTDASVTLCNESGVVQETLHYKESDGNTHYYSCQLIWDEKEAPTTYSVYVNGQNTHRTMQALSAYHTGEATFYKVSVNVMVNGERSDKLRVSASNGMESYIFVCNDDKQFVNEYTLVNDTTGEEANYTLSLHGALRPDSRVIHSTTPEATLEYVSVSYMIPGIDGWVTYMTQYVPKGEATLRPSDPEYGLVALKTWCTTESLESDYDFTGVVNSATVVYAKFESPNIVINDYIRVDENGNMNGAGIYYRMPNLSINGYKDRAQMDSIAFETTGCDGFIILDDEIIESVLPTYKAESGEVLILDEGTMVIRLKENVTVLQVQEFLRSGIIVKPKTDKTHTMQITVYGDDGDK